MPHSYFNLADSVTQRDRTGIDCIDDEAAVVKASIIATEVTAANGNNSRPDLHISIIHEDGHEVSRQDGARACCREYVSQMSDTEDVSHIQILLVEDTPGDARLMKEAFQHLGKPIKMHHAWHGAEALEFLNRKGPFGASPRPDLILLDLDIREMDGRNVLAQINADPHLKSIPTIILAASAHPADVLLCYRLHANCYLDKPTNWDEFDYLAASINRFWLTRAKFPWGKRRESDLHER
jgi:two-component system, chemotaxis family, response regulator Rcp1